MRALEEGIGSRDRTLAQLRDSLLAADVEYKKVRLHEGVQDGGGRER